jgi:hypothetical protein
MPAPLHAEIVIVNVRGEALIAIVDEAGAKVGGLHHVLHAEVAIINGRRRPWEIYNSGRCHQRPWGGPWMPSPSGHREGRRALSEAEVDGVRPRRPVRPKAEGWITWPVL